MISLNFLFVLPALHAVVNAACPSSSVAGIPGCWGQPGCAYVVAKALGPGAACKYNYCNCGGTNVPLLATTISGSATFGCGGYTTQPTANNCPTTAASADLVVSGNTSPIGSQSLPNGATVVTSSSASVVLSELYIPTTYAAYNSLTSVSTVVTADSLSQSTTLVIGPSGVAWIPASASSSRPQLPPPTNLPTLGESSASTINSASKAGSSPGSVLRSSFGSTLLSGSSHASDSAQTSETGHVSGSSPPISTSSASKSSSTNEKDSISGRSFTSSSSSAFNSPVASTTTSRSQVIAITGVQSSYPDAFASTAPQVISLLKSDDTEIWSKTTLSAFRTISKPATVTQAVTITPRTGQPTTTSSAVIIGPGGVLWTNVFGGGGGGGCIWPFCPQPNTPTPNPTQDGSNHPTPNPTQGGSELPTPNPTQGGSNGPTDSPTQKVSTSESRTTSSSSSCTTASTVSDCSVTCSTVSGASTSTCATSCYSTISGCGVSGTTVSSTTACTKIDPWSITASPLATDSATTGTGKPSCIADGAPWFSPTSWCNCGSSSRYPTLPPTSGASSANCAYTDLPSSTIQPVSTSAPPTNIPGVGGIPACHAILAAPGTSAYCDCGGTAAPTLSPTSSTFLNCAYTIVPTSAYNPKIPQPSTSSQAPPPTKSAPPPKYATGQCGVHVREGADGDQLAFNIRIADANKKEIGSSQKALSYGQSMDIDSELPYALVITSNKAPPKSRLFRRGPPGTDQTNADPGAPDSHQKQNPYEGTSLSFSYGADTWTSNDPRCSVGAWDLGNVKDFIDFFVWGDGFQDTRQMDCGFPCPAPTKRSIELRDQEYTDIDNFTSTEIPTLYKRADRIKSLKELAEDGKKRWDAWNAKSGPDKVALCDEWVNERYALGEGGDEPAGSERTLLKNNGVTLWKKFWSFSQKEKNVGDRDGLFRNKISPEQGVYIADVNYRSKNPGSYASDIHWYQWKKTVVSHLVERGTSVEDASKQDFSGLKAFWRMNISNKETIAMLDEAVPPNQRNQVTSFKPDDGADPESNPYFAILGTDNGKGIIYMLTDYKQAMKGKAIKEIRATQDNANWYFWAIIG